MKSQKQLREHATWLLESRSAHLTFDDVIADWPRELRGKRPPGAPHSAWQLLEHMRICQWDILEYIRDPGHESPSFPEGYWPNTETPPAEKAWEASVEAFRADLQAVKDLVSDESADLMAPIPHADGAIVLQEALLLADHNAYHLGQLALLRKLLGAWTIKVQAEVE